MTKKSSFERVHESSVALMRGITHTSGASRMLSLKNCAREEPPALSERRRAVLRTHQPNGELRLRGRQS